MSLRLSGLWPHTANAGAVGSYISNKMYNDSSDYMSLRLSGQRPHTANAGAVGSYISNKIYNDSSDYIGCSVFNDLKNNNN